MNPPHQTAKKGLQKDTVSFSRRPIHFAGNHTTANGSVFSEAGRFNRIKPDDMEAFWRTLHSILPNEEEEKEYKAPEPARHNDTLRFLLKETFGIHGVGYSTVHLNSLETFHIPAFTITTRYDDNRTQIIDHLLTLPGAKREPELNFYDNGEIISILLKGTDAQEARRIPVVVKLGDFIHMGV
jgi:hypothetical protein